MPWLDHFGFIAPYYDRFASAPDAEAWITRLALPVSGLLLDVGGGTGRISHPLRPFTGGIIVADPAFGMARQSRTKPGLRPVCTEAEYLSFPKNCFDRILMVDAFHHVCDQRKTVTELVRVLKPGGRLVIEEPDIRYFGIRLVALGEKLLLMRSHFFSADAAATLFDGLPVRVSLDYIPNAYYLCAEKLDF